MDKGPRYFKGDPTPYCRHCEGEIERQDVLGMRTGYCSSECYEKGAGDDDDG